MTQKNGLFITIEGGEGAGKSTNIEVIQAWLEEASIPCRLTREPGGTELAERIRKLLLEVHSETLSDQAELLLIFAARAQHLQEVIRPALAAGTWVLCDRFTDATYAYQGGGRSLPEEDIALLERWVQGDLQPDYTLLLDAPVEVGLERAGKRGELDRFEREELAFFQRVRDCYLARAAAEPHRFLVLDGNRDLASIAEDLHQALARILKAWQTGER